MKKLISVVALLGTTAMAPSAFADEIPLSVSASIDYVSEYVFRGVSFEAEAIQPGVEVGIGDFSAGVWVSTGVGSDSLADTDEINYYAGYSFSFSDTVSASLGGTIYNFPDADDSYEVNAGLGFDTVLAPSVTAYYDFVLEAFTLEGGISHSVPVGDDTSFDLGATVGLVDGDGVSYEYGLLSASLGYSFTDDVSTYIGANYSLSSDDTLGFTKDTPTDNLFWLGVGIATGF